MAVEEKRGAGRRAVGNVLLVAGFLAVALTGLGSGDQPRIYVLAGLAVLAGVGLRVEAAIADRS